jgi:ribonuclease HI
VGKIDSVFLLYTVTMSYLLQFDGASEPNPGPSGSAYVLFSPIQTDEKGEQFRNLVQEGFTYIPHATNNEAEYSALILGLMKALELGITELDVEGDSNLVVNQVQGLWKVKVPRLVPLQSKANKLLWRLKKWSVKHIYREENTDADRLSKEALSVRCEEHRKA